jgi:uncharacterized membrane-anchored protein
MSDSRALLTGVCGAVCLLILVGMLVTHAWPLWTGEIIYLQVRPMDPRDLFRGEYVILGYDLTRLEVAPQGLWDEIGEADEAVAVRVVPAGTWWEEMAEPDGKPDSAKLHDLRGRRLCVQLEEGLPAEEGAPPLHRAVSLSDRVEPGGMNLCGRVRSGMVDSPGRREPGWPFLTLSYGIDALFVQETRGAAIERAIRDGKSVIAEIAVTSSGRGRLRDLLVDGRRQVRPDG